MLTWSTRLLTEYFAAVNAAEDEDEAVSNAVERAVEMMEAEVGAVVRDGRVSGAYGFGGPTPEAALHEVATGSGRLWVPVLGEFHTTASGLGLQTGDAMIVGRLDDQFAPEERQM